MNDILFVAYFFSEKDGVASMRSRAISKLLEERGNNLIYITKDSFGKTALNNKILWNIFFLTKLLFANYNTIYVSCGPFEHIFLLPLAKIFRKKRIIVDFRDPWSLNIKTGYGNSEVKINKAKLAISELIEKLLYKYCDYFWVCTNGMKKGYSELFGSNSKIEVITNGYSFDCQDYLNSKREMKLNKENKLKFICLGQFAEYSTKKAEKILGKLQKYCQENGPKSIEIHFVGTNKEINSPYLIKFNLINQSIFYDRLPYEKALKIASHCHIGLVISRNEDFDYGTKVYDYIGLGLPIFDSFEEGKDFKLYFNHILTKFSPKFFPETIRNKYNRRNILLPKIHQIDLKH